MPPEETNSHSSPALKAWELGQDRVCVEQTTNHLYGALEAVAFHQKGQLLRPEQPTDPYNLTGLLANLRSIIDVWNHQTIRNIVDEVKGL
ncbi:hypothetical protein [Fibrivirga algicola]|uniref:Uncharacterized protein n=1 Tax=Fibrivirga algicola TaxID=2950420 RepID=A0ABX0QSL8_9BACT|nr:hypothetical protein [Fibrivirga algicola]NID13753.1 hypothetical protein [Fibrivirga algicola]